MNKKQTKKKVGRELDVLRECFYSLSSSKDDFAEHVSQVLQALRSPRGRIDDVRGFIGSECLRIISIDTTSLGSKVFCSSVLLEFFPHLALKVNFYEVARAIPILAAKNEYLWNTLFYSFSHNIRIEKDLIRIYSDLAIFLTHGQRRLEQISESSINPRVVLVSTHQLVTMAHSPTAMCISVCKELHILGYAPALIVLRSAPEESTLPFISPYKANQSIKDFGFHEHEGAKFPVIPLKLDYSTMATEQVASLVKGISPIANIQIGGYFPHGELLARLVPSFLWSTSAFVTPAIHHKFVQIQQDLTDYDAECLDASCIDKSKYKKFFSKLTRCDAAFFSELSPKEKIGFNKDDFVVAIVGNRLDFELKEEELDFFSGLSCSDDSIRFAFFGAISARLEHQLSLACRGHVRCFGHVLNLQELLSSVDLFVNTRRIGGAGGFAMALYAGILGCSIDYGDVGACLPNDLKAEGYPELINVIGILKRTDRLTRSHRAHSILRADETYNEKVRLIMDLLQCDGYRGDLV